MSEIRHLRKSGEFFARPDLHAWRCTLTRWAYLTSANIHECKAQDLQRHFSCRGSIRPRANHDDAAKAQRLQQDAHYKSDAAGEDNAEAIHHRAVHGDNARGRERIFGG